MDDIWLEAVHNLVSRLTGPLKFRFLLQPLMAVILATMAGIKDANTGQPAYFWALLTNAQHRRDMLADGWKSIGKVFLLALLLDVVYQLYVLHSVRLLGAIVVAMLLAIVPYLLVRGSVTRLVRKFSRPKS